MRMALAAQQAIVHDCPDEEDGYVSEKIGECLLLLGRGSEAAPRFSRAYDLLSQDAWLVKNEPDRLARLKELSGTR